MEEDTDAVLGVPPPEGMHNHTRKPHTWWSNVVPTLWARRAAGDTTRVLGGTPSHVQRVLASHMGFMKRMRQTQSLQGHFGCVNTINWNDNGTLIVSGSDDTRAIIWDVRESRDTTTADPTVGDDGGVPASPGSAVRCVIATEHQANIFCAKFMPASNDATVITCAGDALVKVFNVEQQRELLSYTCNADRVKKLATDPGNPHTFLSCAEDGTVRLYDLRDPHICDRIVEACFNVVVSLRRELDPIAQSHAGRLRRTGCHSIAVNPKNACYFALGCTDPLIRIYDRRYLGTGARSRRDSALAYIMPSGCPQSAVTGVCYSKDGRRVAASYTEGGVYVVNAANAVGVMRPHALSAQQSGHFVWNARQRAEVTRETREARELVLRNSGSGEGDDAVALMRDAEQLSMAIRRCGDGDIQVCNLVDEQRQYGDLERQVDRDSRHAWLNPFDDRARQVLSTCEQQRDIGQRPDSDDDDDEDDDDEDDDDEDDDDDVIESTLLSMDSLCRLNGVHRDVVEGYFEGHANVRTVKSVSFLGQNDEYVASGSDCGGIFIWDSRTGELVNVLQGDTHVVNCIEGHPIDNTFISSGIDDDVKVWKPLDVVHERNFDSLHTRLAQNRRRVDAIRGQQMLLRRRLHGLGNELDMCAQQ